MQNSENNDNTIISLGQNITINEPINQFNEIENSSINIENSFNLNLCMARKNQTTGYMIQCPNKKKNGDYCGKHKNYHQSRCLRIDEPNILNSRLSKYSVTYEKNNFDKIKKEIDDSKPILENKKNVNQIPLINNIVDKCYVKSHKKKIKHCYKYNIIPVSPIIPLDYLIYEKPTLHKKGLSPRIIKKSILFYKLINKKEIISLEIDKMIDILQNFMNFYLHCVIHIEDVIKIQRICKKWIFNHKIKIQGPATFNVSLCHNTTDIYNLDELNTIDRKYLFSYLDIDNFIYGFHIESFIEYLKQNKDNINPYNRNIIPYEVSEKAKKMWMILEHKKEKSKMIQGTHYKDIRLRVKNKIINTFQRMDYFGYQTNINWIYNLSNQRLKVLYRHLSIIWFYRANLTQEVRNRIVPNDPLFTDYIHRQIGRQINKYSVMEYIIDIMNKLVSNGVSDSEKNQGCIIVLMAIAEVSPECAASNSWLL